MSERVSNMQMHSTRVSRTMHKKLAVRDPINTLTQQALHEEYRQLYSTRVCKTNIILTHFSPLVSLPDPTHLSGGGLSGPGLPLLFQDSSSTFYAHRLINYERSSS